MTAEVAFGGDGDYSPTSFASRINGNLANDLGNLAQRIFTLTSKHCQSRIPIPAGEFTDADVALIEAAANALEESKKFVAQQMLHRYCGMR